jgi:DNA-binding MarR family transcriptional regulator
VAPADRRVRVIALTDAGRRLLTRADAVVTAVHDDVLAGVDGSERETFLAVLARLVDGPLAAPFHLEKPVRRRRQRAA